ncbi:TRAP transporter small permease subunit [Suttonella ornithocola]|uniref:TRAP transporter small permease subunit n=1 Tax=Suttonella ornithocola TaxID=279832 RepID=UPI001B80746D|nr:TRAP transporter small permease subunit [Suttonella ornithocola]
MALEQKTSGIVSSSLQIPLWYYSAILPFGFLLIAIRVLEHTKDILRHPPMPKIGEPS